jgi:hypothetical protein
MLDNMYSIEPAIKKGIREIDVRTSAGSSRSAVAAKKSVKARWIASVAADIPYANITKFLLVLNQERKLFIRSAIIVMPSA